MSEAPHGHRLRLYRVSLPGQVYSVTICCADREAFFEGKDVRDLVSALIEGSVAHGFSRLEAYVVMPDHVHIMFRLGHSKSLAEALRDLKKIIARQVNTVLGRAGPVWEEGYYERAVRGEDDFVRYLNYMLDNPVRKGLAKHVKEYAWSRIGPWEADTQPS